MLAAIALAVSAAPAPADLLFGSESRCVGGRRHTIAYNATYTAGAQFIDMDGDLGKDLTEVACDLDGTRLLLTFKNYAKKLWWDGKFSHLADHYLVGGDKWCATPNATRVSAPPSKRGAILRRIHTPKFFGPHDFDNQLMVSTSIAQYSEVFKEADVRYGSVDDPQCKAQLASPNVEICLGVNADCQSGQADQPITLLTTPDGSSVDADITCTDCWAAIEGEIFFEFQIKGWRLQKLGAGIRNMALEASAVLTAGASKQAYLTATKVVHAAQHAPLVDFRVGVVPFILFYDIPFEINAELDFSGDAELTFGAGYKLGLGDLDVTWNPTDHWKFGVPKLTHDFTPKLAMTYNLDVQSHVTLLPKFELHFDGIFDYTISANPTLAASIEGNDATKQICLDTSFDMDVVSAGELHIDIDILSIHRDWQFSDTIGSWTGVPIPEKCINMPVSL
jgi:hypothetical protein